MICGSLSCFPLIWANNLKPTLNITACIISNATIIFKNLLLRNPKCNPIHTLGYGLLFSDFNMNCSTKMNKTSTLKY